MGRRRQENALSLFAFQDIITGVAGVMLFILLLLVVQLAIPAAQKIQAKHADGPMFPVASDTDIDRLEKMKAQLAELRVTTEDLFAIQSLRPEATLAELKDSLDQALNRKDRLNQEANNLIDKLNSTKAQKRSDRTANDIASMQDELDAIEAELERLQSGRLIAFQSSDAMPDVWLVDVRGKSTEFMKLQDPSKTGSIRFSDQIETDQLARKLKDFLTDQKASLSVVLLIRPSAAGRASELLMAMQAQGYRIALELLDSETQIVQSTSSPAESQP